MSIALPRNFFHRTKAIFIALLGPEFKQQTHLAQSYNHKRMASSTTNMTSPDVNSDIDSERTEIANNSNPPSRQSSVTTTSDDSDLSDDESGDEQYENLARPIFDFITNRVTELQKSNNTLTSTADFPSFKTFWREKFTELRSELQASQESELFITNPPLHVLEIEIIDDGQEHECPCCLTYRDADIVIRAENGITRDVFLSAIRDGLYGEAVKKEGLPLGEKYGGMLVVKDWDYMIQDQRYLYNGSSYSQMRIWMYCAGTADRNQHGTSV